jgi:hypothetical protein
MRIIGIFISPEVMVMFFDFELKVMLKMSYKLKDFKIFKVSSETG